MNFLSNNIVFGVLLILLVSCSGSKPPVSVSSGEPVALKMRHQIMFRSASETHVFEGYMIVAEDTLLVKAFAGPGVDLFTVVRGSAGKCGELHIAGLEGKMDIEAIGDDIARVYLGGCERSSDSTSAKCEFGNETMVETFDSKGCLVKREFPRAHGIGLVVAYDEFGELAGEPVAKKITMSWGNSSNLMVIKTVSTEILDKVSPNLFDTC